VLTLPKDKVQNAPAAHPMVAEDGVMASVVDQAEDMAEAAAEAVTVVTVADQAEADIRKAMADQTTDLHIKAVTADPILAVQQPVRIRTEAAADLHLEVNHGIKNKPGNREKRRKGFSV
jgi:hypothetical protein